jgi:O-antigen ligase
VDDAVISKIPLTQPETSKIVRFDSIWQDALLGIGLALTVASELRLPGLSFGAGVICLLLWAALQVGRLALWPNQDVAPAMPLMAFWAGALALLMSRFLHAWSEEIWNPEAWHGLLAFFFSALITILLPLQENWPNRVYRAGQWLVSVVVISQVLLFLYFVYNDSLLGSSLWSFSDVPRYRGMTSNPNQLARILCATPFLALYFALGASSRWPRIYFLLLVVLSVVPGLATGSDALLIGWVVGLCTLVFFGLFFQGVSFIGIRPGIWHVLVIGVATLAITWIFSSFLENLWDTGVAHFNAEKGQADLRFRLWSNSIQASQASSWLGWGPGSTSGNDAPFMGREAHNTFLDWLAAVGLSGLMLYVMLVFWALRNNWRGGRSIILLALFSAFTTFSLFGNTFRQPFWWFILVFLAAAPLAIQKQETARSR